MKCPKCGMKLPADSAFCQFCGISIVDYLVSNGVPSSDDKQNCQSDDHDIGLKREASAAPQQIRIEVDSNKVHSRRCKKCGGEIDSITKQCRSCGKQYFRLKKALPIIVLSVLMIGLGALNVVQYLHSQSLQASIDKKSKTISTQKSTISSQEKEIAKLENTAEDYDEIVSALKSGNLGYASSNFNVNESVVVVGKNQTGRKVTLTAHWYDGGKVTTSYSIYNRSASVSYDEKEWTTSTKLTIIPHHEGVTTVTFLNDQDSETFKMIIIVTA